MQFPPPTQNNWEKVLKYKIKSSFVMNVMFVCVTADKCHSGVGRNAAANRQNGEPNCAGQRFDTRLRAESFRPNGYQQQKCRHQTWISIWLWMVTHNCIILLKATHKCHIRPRWWRGLRMRLLVESSVERGAQPATVQEDIKPKDAARRSGKDPNSDRSPNKSLGSPARQSTKWNFVVRRLCTTNNFLSSHISFIVLSSSNYTIWFSFTKYFLFKKWLRD